MVFASLNFLYYFLPANLILYYLWSNKVYRNVLLTLFSFVFYAWGEPIWVALLFFSASVDFFHGKLIEKYRHTVYKKWPLISSVLINLGLLVAFKYSGFIVENVNAVLGTSLAVPKFSLPIGISFYTFQTISYVVDVYRGEVKAQKSFYKFLMFVSLYHQLVAGPIVRYSHIAHEIDHRRLWLADISAGILRFCMGLFKKVAIANVAGELLKGVLSTELAELTVLEAWVAMVLFSFQIYFDFSGYSDMAIGLGRMFGFHYHENFNYPYIARNGTDFWRRWHISLRTFFVDYIYIPLGGNKKFAIRNLFIIWFLTGLWHGASWNYIVWGLFWGILLYLERLFLNKLFKKLPVLVSHLYLLFAVIIGWTIFYFEDFNQLGTCLSIMFGNGTQGFYTPTLGIVLLENCFWFILPVLLSLPVYPFIIKQLEKLPLQFRSFSPYFAMLFGLALLFLCTALLVGKSYNPFLYFRF